MQDSTNRLTDYKIEAQIGSGSFGKVYKAVHTQSGVECAIKIIKKSEIAKQKIHLDLLKSELQALEALDHPHIVKVLKLFDDRDCTAIVMELMPNGNLLDFHPKIFSSRNSRSQREKCAASIVYQVMLALNYIHRQGYVHRDVKLENLMVNVIKSANDPSRSHI